LEKVQRRFTRRTPEYMEYECRHRQLGLWTLEERKNRADLIEVFKMYTGLSILKFDSLFEVSNDSHTRGHSLKLAKHRWWLDPRKHFLQKESLTDGTLLISKLLTVQVYIVSKALWQEQEMQWRCISSWIIPFNRMVICFVVKSGPLRCSNQVNYKVNFLSLSSIDDICNQHVQYGNFDTLLSYWVNNTKDKLK